MTASEIMKLYYKKWSSDTEVSEAKCYAVCADVRRCWRARTAKGRLAAFEEWGDPKEAVRYWMKIRKINKNVTTKNKK